MSHTIPKQTDLSFWIEQLDSLPLECDGLARVISSLLRREEIDHIVHVGAVSIEDAGNIRPHFWVELADGRILDFRARMWLPGGDGVPHGVFTPEPHQQYASEGTLDAASEHPLVFWALAGKPIEEFPVGLSSALDVAPSTKRRHRPG